MRRITPCQVPFRIVPALLALLAALALDAGAAAQVPPAYPWGGASLGRTSELVTLDLCTSPVQLCAAGTPAPVGFAGGSAYDPVNQVFWHSNGDVLESVFAISPQSCDMPCAGRSPVPAVSGLAFDARTESLWILGLLPELARASVPRGGLCPQVQSQCSLASVIPAGMVSAGLALSEKHDLLFYSASRTGAAPANVILVAPMGNPCQPLCRIDLGTPFGTPQAEPITGLAFDDCADELFAVAGQLGIVRARVAFPGCTLSGVSHCVPPGGYRFHGLCLEPQHAQRVGRSCTSAPCPNCSAMRMSANDPMLGNQAFAIGIGSAPAPSVAVPILGIGACDAGVPALCGLFHLASSRLLVVLPPIAIAGPSSCSGSGSLPLPLGTDAALCGAQLCVQALVLCAGGGLALTHGLTLHVTGA